jgi:transposase
MKSSAPIDISPRRRAHSQRLSASAPARSVCAAVPRKQSGEAASSEAAPAQRTGDELNASDAVPAACAPRNECLDVSARLVELRTLGMPRASAACRWLMTIPGVGQLTGLPLVAAIDDPSIARHQRLSGLGPHAASVGGGRPHRRHLQMRRSAGAKAAVRGRQRHADPLQGPAQTQGLGLCDRQAINDAQNAGRSARRLGGIMPAMLRDGTEFVPA